VITLRAPRLAPRHLWLIPGLGLSFVANAIAGQQGLGIAPLLVFGILPHVPALLGSRAVGLFNAMHHPAPPAIVAAVATAGILAPLWLVAGLVWLSHIVVDQALGDGHRAAGGVRRGALA
jgi:hypothetical protein